MSLIAGKVIYPPGCVVHCQSVNRHLASLGALVTILSLGTDFFVQQSLSTSPKVFNTTINDGFTILHSNFYDGGYNDADDLVDSGKNALFELRIMLTHLRGRPASRLACLPINTARHNHAEYH